MDLIRCTSSAPAEQLGELNPDGVQRLLNQADWQSEQVMNVLRGYVVEQIGLSEGVLIVDETGFLKKGNQSAGVQRQYSAAEQTGRHSQANKVCY